MSFVDGTIDKITGLFPHRPSGSHRMNRVDAAPYPVQYHHLGSCPKIPPSPTRFLPTRTRTTAAPLSDLGLAQTHAYYEEILSIPTSAVNQDSAFITRHWWLVHPVTCVDVLRLSTRVHLDRKKWIEKTVPNPSFTRDVKQVLDFKDARNDTLGNVNRELEKRVARGDVAREEGYMGSWKVMNAAGEVEDEKKQRLKEKVEKVGKAEKRKSRNLPAHLEEAAEAAQRAAEEARTRDEYELLH